MNRQSGVGYNQSKGGFNARCGFSQYDKREVAEEDDTTNFQGAVKQENKQKIDDTPDNQEVVGDVNIGEKGDGLNNNFKREKVNDLNKEKVGYQENTQMNIKKQVQFK
mgnify:CR=1 FL=1|tara:strand:- start:50 stop:373 length:324 start_codon:yes stop_codon:yes gene_type:complete